MNRCENCEHSDKCPLAKITNFCEDCVDYEICNIKSSECCEKGHDIECNNGFEDKENYKYYDDEESIK